MTNPSDPQGRPDGHGPAPAGPPPAPPQGPPVNLPPPVPHDEQATVVGKHRSAAQEAAQRAAQQAPPGVRPDQEETQVGRPAQPAPPPAAPPAQPAASDPTPAAPPAQPAPSGGGDGLDERTRVGAPRLPGSGPDVGTTIGPYRLDRLVATGGMGRVYAGTDTRLNRPVAIKLVLAAMAQSDDFVRRFEREAAIMAKIESPHVVTVYDHGRFEGVPYLVAQYAAGGDLARVLAEHGPLDGPVAADVCAQVADALAAAHAVGVIHRDVKAPNVLLRDERLDRPHVYLGDFGVAHTDSSGLTQPGSVAGTWNYLAPERAVGDKGSTASDIYALGCLFYECLTGQPPYAGSDVEVALAHVQEPVPQLPEGRFDPQFTAQANAILARTLAKNPDDRPVSAIEVRDQFRLISGRDHAFAAGPTVRKRGRGKRVALGVTAGVVALALVGGGAAWALWPEGEPGAPPAPTPVAGDLDGDGLGELVVGPADVTFNPYSDEPAAVAYVQGADGTYAADDQLTATFPYPNLIGDVNGDGQDELVRVSGNAATFPVETTAEGVQSGLFKIPRNDQIKSFFLGDFNGDGRDDVGLLSMNDDDVPTEGATAAHGVRTRYFVVLSQEDGTWSWRERWLASDFVGQSLYIQAIAGDVDGDGDDDLLELDKQDFGDDHQLIRRVLLAEDGEFVEAEDLAVPESNIANPSGVTLADVDGDETDELIYTDYTGTVETFRLEDGAWSRVEWAVEGNADEEVDYDNIGISDLDGDGDEDLYFLNRAEYTSDGPTWLNSVTAYLSSDGSYETVTYDAPGLDAMDYQYAGLGRSVDSNF